MHSALTGAGSPGLGSFVSGQQKPGFAALLGIVLASVLAAGCQNAPDSDSAPEEETAQSQEALTISTSRHAIGLDLVRPANMIHGVAGDERFVFLSEPLNGAVRVYSRLTGKFVADVPAPPGGFILPFTLRVPEKGHLVVLDAGGFPNPNAPAIPKVYDYHYTSTGLFNISTNLTRTVSFEGLPVVFSEDVEVTSDGTYIVSDSVIGSLWLIEPNGTIKPGLLPSSFEFGQGLPKMAPCVVGPVAVEGIPYDLGGGLGPGVGSLASKDGFIYWGGFCHGGIHRISIATVRDQTRSGEVRAQEIQVVSPKPAGSLELLKGLAFNKFSPGDKRLYATDCFNMSVIRIDTNTGTRKTLLQDANLMNFPVAAHFVPSPFGIKSLLVASDQEHRFDALNFGIDHDMFHPPFIATEILFVD